VPGRGHASIVRQFVDGKPLSEIPGAPVRELVTWDARSLELWRYHALSCRGGTSMTEGLLDERHVRVRRRQLRCLAVLAGTLGGSAFFFCASLSVASLDRGPWFCPVCGNLEERTLLLGWTLAASTGEERSGYRDWYQRVARVEYEHGWVRVGCHSIGLSGVACTRVAGDSFLHASVPLLPDEKLARTLVRRLARRCSATSCVANRWRAAPSGSDSARSRTTALPDGAAPKGR